MIQEIKLQQGDSSVTLHIIRSARKSIGLEVRGEDVLLRIPARLSDRNLKQFLEEKKQWILEKSAQMQERQEERETTGAVSPAELSAEEIEAIKEKIASRVRHYSRVMGVTVGRITIRNQRTRWGSCSVKGNLNFNYQLYYLPEELLDYVVVHELAHRRHMDHSAEFWAEVGKYCPDYKKRREKLKEYKLA
ncbi:M48 family metallopeptidase [Blautia sp. HCP3S3_G3]|uniref:M48 family metallopeptidase n=1 Tax=Blautia sp. HCP3S3_G3 TaxID=3438913 RepID=UPI003F8AEF50